METTVKTTRKIKYDRVLNDFIMNRNRKTLKDLKGKISFSEDYDYKSMRS
jgi:hypothetical protein